MTLFQVLKWDLKYIMANYPLLVNCKAVIDNWHPPTSIRPFSPANPTPFFSLQTLPWCSSEFLFCHKVYTISHAQPVWAWFLFQLQGWKHRLHISWGLQHRTPVPLTTYWCLQIVLQPIKILFEFDKIYSLCVLFDLLVCLLRLLFSFSVGIFFLLL